MAQAAQNAKPVDIVKSLYALDRSGRGDEIFADRSAAMARYFSPGFVAVWRLAKAHDLSPPLLEGDPLTGQQEAEGARVLDLVPDGPASVVATLALPVAPGAEPSTFKIRFDFLEIAGRNYVDDIEYPAALSSLSELADRTMAARLAAYVGAYRKILAHVLSVSGANP